VRREPTRRQYFIDGKGALMLTEVNLFGIFVAPLSIYAVAAVFVTLLLRSILWRTGALNWFWHVALFEIALYVCVLCLLILYV